MDDNDDGMFSGLLFLGQEVSRYCGATCSTAGLIRGKLQAECACALRVGSVSVLIFFDVGCLPLDTQPCPALTSSANFAAEHVQGVSSWTIGVDAIESTVPL